MTKKPFLFLGDLLKSEAQLDYKISEHFHLRRANKEQIVAIKEILKKFLNVTYLNINPYETIKEKNIESGGYSHYNLYEKDWNYSILEHNQSQVSNELQLALSLSSLNLNPLFEKVRIQNNTLSGTLNKGIIEVIFFLDHQFDLPEKLVAKENIDEIEEIHELIKNIIKDDKHKIVFKAANDYSQVRKISKDSPFKIISYIAILELLLTSYKPNHGNDKSISQQLKNKIQLINNSLKSKIPFDKYFNGPDTNTIGTIVEMLYLYRNDISHGNEPDFDKTLFPLKKNKDNIPAFLDLLVREVIVYSLRFPQLIKDLKEC